MARPPSPLAELVRTGTFRARTQHKLLGTAPDLPWQAFATLQARYRNATNLEYRRVVARDFERLVREAQEEAARAHSGVREIPADAFTIEHFRAWAADLILDTGDPWIIEPFQEAFLTDVLAGHTECWLVVPEGNGKTTTLAGLALYHSEFTMSAWVPVAASSREQAEIMYRQAEGFVKRTPRLRAMFRCLEGYRRIRCDDMGSRIQVFAADDRTGDGVIPTLALVDELHRHRDLRLYRTWRGKLGKRGGQIATISTAGEPGSEFEDTRELIRQTSEQVERSGSFLRAISSGVVLHEWAVPEGGNVEDMQVVKAANPFDGVTIEALTEKRASPTMTLAHWSRFVCNMPTRSVESAITEAEWNAARTDERIPDGEPVWLGLDLGWKYDTTALVPLWVRDPEFRLLGPATILEPPRNGNQLDAHLVEDALLRIHARNPLEVVVMDMTNGEQLSQWITEELGAQVVDRTQGNALAAMDYARFMEALRMGWLKHTGHAGLTAHVLNAVVRLLPQGDAKFERPKESRTVSDELQRRRVIDALVAAAMVHTSAAASLTEPESAPMAAFR